MRITSSLLAALLGLQCAACADASAADDIDPARTPPAGAQSVRHWVSCDGRDDTAGLTRAFAAAHRGAFTLLIDCPVRLHVGHDIDRPIFIDDGTRVRFTGAGTLSVDNERVPAFVIANASHIDLAHWRIEYHGGLAVEAKLGGHGAGGRFVPGSEPANAFNDLTLTPWLEAHRGIRFDRREGNVNSRWSGATNYCAIFFVIGDVADLRVTDLQVTVPARAGAEHFVPVVFAFDPGYRSQQTVTAHTPFSSQAYAVPHDMTFADVTLDGTYMGWVGGVRDTLFERITSRRYADLQDASGGRVGGMAKWFAPPHLFYLSYPGNADEGLVNRHIEIRDVRDEGPRVGTARDKGGADSLSGYALSLKIGCWDCLVTNYRSNRPDGFLDVLPSNGLTISNVRASYDSSFLNDLFPGWRFPAGPYQNVQFRDVSIEDLAPVSVQPPIGDATGAGNRGIVFDRVAVKLEQWRGKRRWPLPQISGPGTSMDLRVDMNDARLVATQRDALESIVEVRPPHPRAGEPVELRWQADHASACRGEGLLSGELPLTGERRVAGGASAADDFVLRCRNEETEALAKLALRIAP